MASGTIAKPIPGNGIIVYKQALNVTIAAGGIYTLSISDVVPTGYWEIAVVGYINYNGSNYVLPYYDGTGLAKTYVQGIGGKQVNIKNNSSAWTSCNIYLAIICIPYAVS